jgi:hypothetical protein
VIVEKLLQPFVGVIDAQLFERVELENFETGNIQNTDEMFSSDVQGLVNSRDDPQEESVVESSAKSVTRLRGQERGLVDLYSLVTHNTERLDDGSGQLGGGDLEEFSGLVDGSHVNNGGRFVSLEGNVTQVQDGGNDTENQVSLVLSETKSGQGGEGSLEFTLFVQRFNLGGVVIRDVLVVTGVSQTEGVTSREASEELVEDVEVTFAFSLVGNTRLLEQVGYNGSSGDLTRLSEGDLDEFTETRRVIVLGGLGVTKSFEKRISLDKLFLELTVTSISSQVTGNSSQILDDLFGVLSLTCS